MKASLPVIGCALSPGRDWQGSRLFESLFKIF